MGGKALRQLGMAIDRHFLKKVGAQPIPGSQEQLLLLCYHTYHGRNPLELPGNVTVNPGDPVGEFHLSNIKITEIAGTVEQGLNWRLMELVKAELMVLADACVKDYIPNEVKAFYGVNVLAPGPKRLGFTMVPIPKGWKRLWLGLWESILRLIFYSFKTKKKATLKRTMDPYEVWISREELIDRFCQKNDLAKFGY